MKEGIPSVNGAKIPVKVARDGTATLGELYFIYFILLDFRSCEW
jgi:hypothetical protein